MGFDCPLTRAHIPPTSSDLLNIQVLELVGQCSVDRAQPTHKKLHPKLHAGESPIVSTCYPENDVFLMFSGKVRILVGQILLWRGFTSPFLLRQPSVYIK